MNLSHCEMLRDRLNAEKPPISLDLLELLVTLDWTAKSEEEIFVLGDIIIRLGADVLICNMKLEGYCRYQYKKMFLKIEENIELSNLPSRSDNFRDDFNAYRSYLLEFTTPSSE